MGRPLFSLKQITFPFRILFTAQINQTVDCDPHLTLRFLYEHFPLFERKYSNAFPLSRHFSFSYRLRRWSVNPSDQHPLHRIESSSPQQQALLHHPPNNTCPTTEHIVVYGNPNLIPVYSMFKSPLIQRSISPLLKIQIFFLDLFPRISTPFSTKPSLDSSIIVVSKVTCFAVQL